MSPEELEKLVGETFGSIPKDALRIDTSDIRIKDLLRINTSDTLTHADALSHPIHSEHLRVDSIADDTIHIDYDFYKDENSKSRDILYNAYMDALERVLRHGAETPVAVVFRQLLTEHFFSKEYPFDGRKDFFSFLRTLRGIRETEHTIGNIVMFPISSMYGGRLSIDLKFTSDREYINRLVPNYEIDTILELIS